MPSREAVLAAVAATLANETGLRWGYVFGSVARGEPHRDVAVMPSTAMPTGAVAWGQIVARLESAAGTNVDLVDLSQADLPFVGPMLTERVVVLDRERTARCSWEADTTSRWLDFQPSYEEFLRVRDLAMRQRLQGKH